MNIVKKIVWAVVQGVGAIIAIAVCFGLICVGIFCVVAPFAIVFSAEKWFALWELAVFSIPFFIRIYSDHKEMLKAKEKNAIIIDELRVALRLIDKDAEEEVMWKYRI